MAGARKIHHVYAKCNNGKEISLQTEMSGTRSECLAYVRAKVRNNRPTHFNFISSLTLEAAERRYL